MSLSPHARLIYGSPLRRPRNAILIVLVLLVLLISSTSALFRGYFSTLSPGALQVYGLSFLAALLLAIVPISILWFLDRREPESRWLYLIAILWGALIATGLAFPVNQFLIKAVGDFIAVHPDIQAILGSEAQMVLAAPIAGPLVEETTKGMGLLLLFWLLRAEFDGVIDGFIYGALVGIGFNILEAPLYVTKGFLHDGTIPLYFQMADRFALFGLSGHALYTGLFGMGLGLARQTTHRWLRYVAPVVGWLLGFSAHFVNNGLGLFMRLFVFFGTGKPMPDAPDTAAAVEAVQPFLVMWLKWSGIVGLIMFPFLVIAIALLWQSSAWERRVMQAELATEGEPMITPAEYAVVQQDRPFRTRRIPAVSRQLSGAIVKAQGELALRKWRVKQTGGSPDTDPLVASWREELVRLRNSIQPASLV